MGAVQGEGARVWVLAGASWASAASTSAMGMSETGMCQKLPFAPEYEVVMMKAGKGA